REKEITLLENSSGEKSPNVEISTDTSGITPVKSQVNVPSIPQVRSSNKSRLPISILPEDPEEKRKHIIGLVLERFPYLSLSDSDERADKFNLDSSTLCLPIYIGRDHK